MNEDELTGTMALVNPELDNDPLQQQGKAGMIAFAEFARDDFFVTFPDGKRGLYSSDALMIFKKPAEIYQELIANTRDIEIPDMKALYRIGMLLDAGKGKDIKEAMQLAEQNPGTHSRALISLKEHLGPELEMAQSQSAEVGQSRGR